MNSISCIINGMNPAPAFPRFSSLPVEIRLMIWKLSLEPRIIEIDFCPREYDGFFTTHSLPPALHVCQESRNAVIASYPLCFGSIYFPATLRFNFSIDTLYISSSLCLATYPDILPLLFTTFKDREIAELQWLAIDAYLYGNRRGPNDRICTEIRNAVGRLAGLKEIVFAYDIEDWMGYETRAIKYSSGQFIKLCEEIPGALQSPPVLHARAVQDQNGQTEHFEGRQVPRWKLDSWEVKKIKHVYSWRPDGMSEPPQLEVFPLAYHKTRRTVAMTGVYL